MAPGWENALPATERQSATARGEGAPLIDALIAGQRRAVERVAGAGPALEGAAKRVSAALSAGGPVIYVGAGSSGLLAVQDGLELPGTFGLGPERIRFVTPNVERFAIDSSGEDDGHAADQAIDALSLGPDDIVIAVSASGATPFTLAAARRAKERRASVVAIVCRRARRSPPSPISPPSSTPARKPSKARPGLRRERRRKRRSASFRRSLRPSSGLSITA